MTSRFELCVRDTRAVIHDQLANPEFRDSFNSAPYRQFTSSGDRIFSNLLSADWAHRQADEIAKDKTTHGSSFVPVVSGLDKTTVSVATGHQEYHPFYISAGNLTNSARRGHGAGVIPVAFLPIPKVSKRQKKSKDYQRFVRQLYHTCIARIFAPLKPGMTKPEIVRFPDGHFRRAVYGIGPVIADYPEQVWLSGIVQNWCPKCNAPPYDLDRTGATRRTHEKDDVLIDYWDSGTLWDRYGIRDDVVPFTHGFPRADIHELMAPDLLHQLIKGTFKDHLVTWVNEYILTFNGENKGLEIIQEIDRRISAVPTYPGLRRFKDGRDFAQWTGDDSKALMKVYLAAIVGFVPDKMVQCLASFMEICYIFRRNAITATALRSAEIELARFHRLREVFVEEGVRAHCSLPRQHALVHFLSAIPDFGSPNGLCSSITESKHITAVKEPWRRSSRYEALPQMLQIIVRLDKLSALHTRLMHEGWLVGSTAAFIAMENEHRNLLRAEDNGEGDLEYEGDEMREGELDERRDDVGPVDGPRLATSILLSKTTAPGYPKDLLTLSATIEEPQLVTAFLEYLYSSRHPTRSPPVPINKYVSFTGKIHVHHSATARFYAPSDACGAGGMQRQMIRCNRWWRNHGRMDTILVSMDDQAGMDGMMVAQARLFFSFSDPLKGTTHHCALVNWFPTVERDTTATGMWVVEREVDEADGTAPLQVIPVSTIVRGIHLLPVFGREGVLPEGFSYMESLEAFDRYYVNHFIDYHAHEVATQNQAHTTTSMSAVKLLELGGPARA
ncbi:hypothetical protein MD484_g5208, partial [Candolleomyces efflorescens]